MNVGKVGSDGGGVITDEEAQMSTLATNPKMLVGPLLILLLAWVPPALPAHVATLGSGTAAQIDELFAEWDKRDSPGAAVLIVERGRIILEKGYGLANLEHGIPITSSTRFDLASTSKQFTAMAILLLAEQGLLDLEDDIRIHLPDMPDLGTPVTIDNLIHHTSGLWDYWQVIQFTGFERWDYLDSEQMMTLLEHQEEFMFEPGSRWGYCNSNYALLAEIVSRVTGKPFDEWTTANIFEPLGMHSTGFWADCFEVIPKVASPYEPHEGGFKSGRQADVTFAGQGHVFSNLEDMAIWLDSFRTGQLAGPTLISKMYTKGRLNDGEEIFYAAGLGVGEYRGMKTVSHSGQTGGFKSDMVYCPEAEVGVLILANVRSVDVEDLSRRVLDVYLGDLLEREPEAVEAEEAPFIDLDPEILDRYVGSYEIEGAPVIVSAMRIGDNLLGALSGEGMAFIYPISERVFLTGHRRVSIEFIPDASGEINRVRLDVEGNEMWANRIAGGLTDEEAHEYAGHYYSEAVGMVYSVSLEDGDIFLSHRRVGEEKTTMLYSGEDVFASGFGFIYFTRDEEGDIRSFSLSHEFLGDGRITFERLGSKGTWN